MSLPLFQDVWFGESRIELYFCMGILLVAVYGHVACTPLKPRELASFVCAVFLIFGLQYFSPDPLMMHLRVQLWLHKSEYLARVSAAQPSPEGRLSIVLYRYTEYSGTGRWLLVLD